MIAVPPDDDKSHQVSPKVCGIIVGCLFGLLFLGCCCEGIWRKHKLRRQAARQPDPEQPAQDSVQAAPPTAVPETDGEDKDNKESGNIDSKDSIDTDDGSSIFMVPLCRVPPPAYTPKTDKVYKPLGGGEW